MNHSNDSDDAPIPGLSGLADVTPPPALVPAVMARIAQPAPFSLWSWLRQRHRFELRLSPLGAGAFALLVIVAGAWWSLSPRPEAMTIAVAPAWNAEAPDQPAAVVVRFVLLAKGARKVAIAGDFNGWSTDQMVLENADGQGTFVANVRLPRGAHEYMFVVDGQWVTDPAAAERRPDGFGRNNAILRL